MFLNPPRRPLPTRSRTWPYKAARSASEAAASSAIEALDAPTDAEAAAEVPRLADLPAAHPTMC